MVKRVTNFISWLASGGLLLGAVGIVVAATPLAGNRALIVRSGSMEPAISVGDLVVIRPDQFGSYLKGDVISFEVPGRQDMVVTHRIVEVQPDGFVTKGDANPEQDNWIIPESSVMGRQLVVVPLVGKLLAFAKTRAGFVSLVLLPSLIVVLAEARVIWRELRKKVPRVERGAYERPLPPALSESAGYSPLVRGRKTLPTFFADLPPVRVYVDGIVRRGAGVAILLLMMAVMTPATFALYTDTGTSSNNVFTAADDFGGFEPGDVVINEVMWMGTTASTNDEWLELRNLTSNPVDLAGWSIVNAGSGGSPVITLTGTIPANGYFLISARLSTHPQSALNDSITVNQQDSNVGLLNDGEQLTLKDNLATIIDQTPLPPPAWPAGVNTTLKQSMERNDPPSDGTVDANWHTCTNAGCNDGTFWDTADGNDFGTPKAANL